MNQKIRLLVIVLALAVVIAGASVLYQQLSEDAAPDRLAIQTNGTPETTGAQSDETDDSESPADSTAQPESNTVPNFAVNDQEGNSVLLSEFFGKPIVLNFWASWCSPCRNEMPHFQEKYLEYGDQVHFLMVNMTDGYKDTVPMVAGYVKSQGYTFPVFYDEVKEAARAYGVTSLPTTYFIDADGNAVAYVKGSLDAETLQQGIDMILP